MANHWVGRLGAGGGVVPCVSVYQKCWLAQCSWEPKGEHRRESIRFISFFTSCVPNWELLHSIWGLRWTNTDRTGLFPRFGDRVVGILIRALYVRPLQADGWAAHVDTKHIRMNRDKIFKFVFEKSVFKSEKTNLRLVGGRFYAFYVPLERIWIGFWVFEIFRKLDRWTCGGLKYIRILFNDSLFSLKTNLGFSVFTHLNYEKHNETFQSHPRSDENTRALFLANR